MSTLVDNSLTNETFPSSFKHTIVQPLLEEPSLDHIDN